MSAPLTDGVSFAEYVERLGGRANAETGLEQMVFYAQVHPSDVGKVAQMLCRSILRPELTEKLLDRERAVVLRELSGAAADPSDVVQDAILAALFAEHPLGRPVGGTASEVQRASRSDIVRHHAMDFLAKPMALVIMAPSRSGLGDWAHEEDLPEVHVERMAPLGDVATVIPRWPEKYAWLCLAARSPSRSSEERYAYHVLATLLGSSPASLLYHRLRGELGLAYSFHTWVRGYMEAGAWRVLVGVDQGNGGRVVGAIQEALTEVAKQGLRDGDLRMARRQAEVRLAIDADDLLEMVKLVATHISSTGLTWSPDNEVTALRAVPAEAVSAAASQVLANHVTVVRPEA